MSDALNLLLFHRLFDICRKMERLAARFQTGKLWRCTSRGRPRVVDPQGVAVAAGGRAFGASARIWPTRFAWLVRLGGWRVAGCGTQLRSVLETPEMVALLVASPQATRILRPLRRMLAVETSVLPPRATGAVPVDCPAGVMGGVAVTQPTEPKKRVRQSRVVVDWGRIPLPRGVLAATRRQGSGRIDSRKGEAGRREPVT